ncbi:hypothetical protein [Paraburkholderia bannensis]|uniref:hypothetical protein n=1 Tax=Paraburkholderia bannensis TaxID=765414 RepID=UPI002AB75F40|nr:hypothetical protein [Paraburkholderia bannensis]
MPLACILNARSSSFLPHMGVRSDAQIAANAGDVTLTAYGDVSLVGVAAQQT